MRVVCVVGLLLASAAAVDTEVSALLSTMSLADKVGQMTQINIDKVTECVTGPDGQQQMTVNRPALRTWLSQWRIGSLLNSPWAGTQGPTCGRLGWDARSWRGAIQAIQEEAAAAGLPPILFGIDSVHGANYVRRAVLMPQQIGLAASFDERAAERFGFITGRDTRAAGIPWLFAPILGIATQPLWPRVYETFGEDPLVAARLGSAVIVGMQTPAPPGEYPARAAACAKHYIGYSDSRSGHDRAPGWIPHRHLLQYYAPPFEAAVEAGVLSVMESYSEVDGVPMAANKLLLRELLRDRMQFDGMMVTDWAEIQNLHGFHHVASSPEDAVWLSINQTSIDMSMVPLDASFAQILVGLVESGQLPESRVDESAGRVLQLKKDLGLLETPVPGLHQDTAYLQSDLISQVGSAQDVAVARDMARSAIVLLQNGNGGVSRECCRGRPGASIGDVRGALDWLCSGWAKEDCVAGWASLDDAAARQEFSKWADAWYQNNPRPESCDFSGSAELFDCSTGPTNVLLPLPTDTPQRVLVTGPTADSIGSLSTGWSIHWQGVTDDSEFTHGSSIKAAMEQLAGTVAAAGSVVEYTEGCKIRAPTHATASCELVDLPGTKAKAAAADVVVVCLGEEPYTEKPGDIDQLELSSGQIELVKALDAAGTPIVLVLVEGRPRLLQGIQRLPNVHAVVHALAPGPEGGLAVAEVLYGAVNPSGRMPITYPGSTGSIHYPHWHAVSSQCAGSPTFLSAAVQSCPVDFLFGQGLSYTTFEYEAFRWYTAPWRASSAGEQQTTLAIGSSFTVDLEVHNTGPRDANHSVLLYFIQHYRRVTPEANRLLGFKRVSVRAGERAAVSFALHTSDFMYVGVDFDRVVETGLYTLALGHAQYGAPSAEDGLLMNLTHAECPSSTGQCPVSMTRQADSPATEPPTDPRSQPTAPAPKPALCGTNTDCPSGYNCFDTIDDTATDAADVFRVELSDEEKCAAHKQETGLCTCLRTRQRTKAPTASADDSKASGDTSDSGSGVWAVVCFFLVGGILGSLAVLLTQKFLMKRSDDDDVPRSVAGRALQAEETYEQRSHEGHSMLSGNVSVDLENR